MARTKHISLEGQTPVEITFDNGVTLRIRLDKAEGGISIAANEVKTGVLATELVLRPRTGNSMIVGVE